jgi:tripartite-type tricarboxylate transporter receptor subunit TctC
MRGIWTLCWAVAYLLTASLTAARAEEFYAGKTLTLICPLGAGGEYDGYLRLLQRHIAKHIPGAPSVNIVYMPGGGGLRAVNYAANGGPQDGTQIVMIANGLLLFEAIGLPNLETSLSKFKWIGNFSALNSVTAVWKKTGVRSIEDARHRRIIIGSSGAGSTSALLPWAQNALAGTKFKVVLGYKGQAQMTLAMRRGELDGRAGSSWFSFLRELPEARDGAVVPISQVGVKRDPLIPDVPLLTEVVGDDPVRIAVARLISEAVVQARTIAAPPGVPDDRAALLKTAFVETMKDPDYVAEAKRGGLDLTWTDGATIEKMTKDVLSAPPQIIERLRQAVTKQAE